MQHVHVQGLSRFLIFDVYIHIRVSVGVDVIGQKCVFARCCAGISFSQSAVYVSI
jgi:hypothetical protein